MKSIKKIDIALQGGGSHGAFTWGVLDRLLADDRIEIDGISGTSAGAMNAVVVADGMSGSGGKSGARQALHDFWKAVSNAAQFSLMQRTPFDRLMGNWAPETSPGYLLFDLLTRMVSPYEFNPLDINPLRNLVEQYIDFERVRACSSIKLFISATNVRTGKAKIFRRPELTVDTVMASACLPQLFRAVEIDGEAYWDGGYTGNPALLPLINETEANDLVIIQINPIVRRELPRTAFDISNRLNEITFNASLINEISSIMLLKNLVDTEKLNRAQYTEMRLHRISAENELQQLNASTKLNAEWPFLLYLHDIGYQATERWIEQNFQYLGERSTLDDSSIYYTENGDKATLSATPILQNKQPHS